MFRLSAGSRPGPSTVSIGARKVELHLNQFLPREDFGRGHEFCDFFRAAFALKGEFICVHGNNPCRSGISGLRRRGTVTGLPLGFGATS